MSNDNKKIIQESLFTEEECPTIKKEEQLTDPRIMLRIKTVALNKLLNEVVSQSKSVRNDVLNTALEIGLPILAKRYGMYSQDEEQNIINQKDELIESLHKTIEIQNKQLELFQNQIMLNFQAIRNELLHINSSTSIQEYINSSTYEHLKFLLNMFIATNNAGTLPEELSERYDNRIAAQFKEKKDNAVRDYKLSNMLFVNNKEQGDKE